MGTQFFWFYDVLVVGIILAITFRCYKRGFVSVIVRFVTTLLAFAIAASLSMPLANVIYDNFLGDVVQDYISDGLGGLAGGSAESDVDGKEILSQLSSLDTDKIKVNGVPVTELNLEPDPAGKVTLDISNLDLSQTGIEEVDLSIFGIDPKTVDFAKINAGKVNISQDDLEKHSAGTIVLTQTLVQSLQNEDNYKQVSEIIDKVSETIPIPAIDVNDAVSDMIKVIIETTSDDATESLIDGFVKPMILPVLSSILFFIIFILMTIILAIVAKSLNLVNRIPGIGKINSLFGAIVGFLNGLIVVAIVCVLVHIIIMLTGNTIVLLNTMTIDKTVIFKYIYNLEFLNLL